MNQPTALSPEDIAGGCVIDPGGRRAATVTQAARPPATKQLRVFDLESGELLRAWPLVPEGETEPFGPASAVTGKVCTAKNASMVWSAVTLVNV